jgi:hypothetical protein
MPAFFPILLPDELLCSAVARYAAMTGQSGSAYESIYSGGQLSVSAISPQAWTRSWNAFRPGTLIR